MSLQQMPLTAAFQRNLQLNRVQYVVVFTLDAPCYALPLSAVERVVRAMEITPLPKAPAIVLGVINAQGRIIPVLDIRARFRLPARPIDCNDRFIIARTAKRTVALVVDDVVDTRELPEGALIEARQALPFTEYLQGVVKLDDSLVLISDLEQFLSLEEETGLAAALGEGEDDSHPC